MSANNRPTLAENLAEERGTETPDHHLGPFRLARRLLLRGETLIPTRFAEAHRCSNGVVNQACADLGRLGYEVIAERVSIPDPAGGRGSHHTEYRLANPTFIPSEAAFEAERKRRADEGERKRLKGRAKRGKAGVSEPKRTNAAKVPAVRDASHAPAGGVSAGTAASSLPTLPALGQSVTVYALVMNEDGSLTMGLRNGVASWMTTVQGVAER